MSKPFCSVLSKGGRATYSDIKYNNQCNITGHWHSLALWIRQDRAQIRAVWLLFPFYLKADYTFGLPIEGVGMVIYLLFHWVFFTMRIKTGSSKRVAQTIPTIITS